jgi:hypothetical protein
MSLRFWGALLWLFALHVVAITGEGVLAQDLWLNIGSALGMFSVAAYILGLSLPPDVTDFTLSHICALVLIIISSALLTLKFINQLPYQWYDLMICMAAPQVFVLSIGYWLTTRRHIAKTSAV